MEGELAKAREEAARQQKLQEEERRINEEFEKSEQVLSLWAFSLAILFFIYLSMTFKAKSLWENTGAVVMAVRRPG
uniref:Uncharacterized protein n=1 Tax=Periophthalmus magnuspinnatus TaxID=409849 RepID=A0A3B4AN00_9GOBI